MWRIWKQKTAYTHKKLVDLSVGGEGRENSKKKLVEDVWNRIYDDLWRSDAVLIIDMRYN